VRQRRKACQTARQYQQTNPACATRRCGSRKGA
jgi:hypothetical protein